MSAQYSRNLMKVSLAKMLQTIGWHSINTTPLEILTDILIQYLKEMGKLANDYANEFGCTEPNLDHLGLVFREFHVNLADLEEYVTYVDFGQGPTQVPKYPIPKEDHLNFLKPGSKEVVTRPVHIHEHLPPMFAIQEANENENETTVKQEETEDATVDNATPVFKRPAEISPGENFKRPRLIMEEEGRPTREISSVMMTTSGYISPAREGKLPESRTPLASLDTITMVNSNQVPPTQNARSNRIIKKVDKRKDKVGKELFKPLDDKVKKVPSMKDVAKSKQIKAVQNPLSIQPANNFMLNNDLKVAPILNNANKLPLVNNKANKALAAARLKTEKLNTTITPIPMKPTPPSTNDNVDKLFTEPDKKKVNIFKKISNVRNEKLENKIMKIKEEIRQESRESSPVLIIDESIETSNKVHHISNDITIELIDTKPPVNKTPEKVERAYFYDDSPPGTPLRPKTPELISHSPPLAKEKRKRKDKSKVKKVQKLVSPNRTDADVMEIDLLRPKTPEAQIERQEPFQQLPPTIPFPFPIPTFAGPGLIPSTFFPNLPLPLALGGLRKPQFMPPIHTPLPINFMQPIKPEDPSVQPRPKTPAEKLQSPMQVPTPSTTQPSPPIVGNEEPPAVKVEKKTKEHKKDKKDRIKKKNKKDKVKDKAEKKKLKEEKKDKVKIKREKKEKKKEKELRENDVSIPKLTLKLGSPSPRPETPDTRKLNIKPVIKKEEEEVNVNHEATREMSPELAKISALVTGQPKPKNINQTTNLISNDNYPTSSTDSFNNQVKKTMFKPMPKIRTKEVKREPIDTGLIKTPSSYIHDSQEEESREETPVMCPPPKSGPGPGRPRIHPIKPKPTKPNKQQIPMKDCEGNEVWICPGCGRQDDGSPMIGCDDCDAWYHWVCVGIQVPPDDSEDWYCRHCLAKKQEVLQTDKKKKRKKREKKEH